MYKRLAWIAVVKKRLPLSVKANVGVIVENLLTPFLRAVDKKTTKKKKKNTLDPASTEKRLTLFLRAPDEKRLTLQES